MELLRNHRSDHILGIVHGFGNTPFFGLTLSGVYSRELDCDLVVLFTWPSNPDSSHWLVKLNLMAKYTHADQHMQASMVPFMGAVTKLHQSTGKRLYFKCHSLGCYLLVGIMERMKLHGENVTNHFAKVILDAPDMPAWYFNQVVSTNAEDGVKFLHLFNPKDKAVAVSRERRLMERECPGNEPIVFHPNVQAIDCSRAVSTSPNLNHDYGRHDGFAIMDQRDFLAGVPPQERLLDLVNDTKYWILRTGR